MIQKNVFYSRRRDPRICGEMLEGQPKRALDEWSNAKADPELTFDECHRISSLLFAVMTELDMSPAQYAEVELAVTESDVKCLELVD